MDKDYVKKVEKFIMKLTEKYAKRKSIFEPLSKLLGEYWNDTFLRAVRNVMFEKISATIPDSKTKLKRAYICKFIWQIKRHSDCPMEHNYVEWIAKKIINEEKYLRKIIWHVKGWGDPDRSAHKQFFFLAGTSFKNESEFYDMYWKQLECFVSNEEKRIELMHAIFYACEDRFQDGLRVGARSYKEKMLTKTNDKLVDIFNNIEFNLSDLKKIIDE